MKITKQKFLGNANKPGRWLAYKFKKEQQKNQIMALKDKGGKEKRKDHEMREIAENFDQNLYIENNLQPEKQ